MMADLGEFARRIKLSGTTEELESFHYLKTRIEAYGYRTELLFHDAYISLPGRARVVVDGRELPCITHSMSVATPTEGVAGDLVAVGEGEEADFAGRDLSGKFLLVDGIATEEVAARASRAGALGHIHVSPNEHLYEMCISPVWGSPSQHTRRGLPMTAVCSIPHNEGGALKERRLAGEPVRVRLWAEVDTGWRKTPLLVTELDAQDEDENAPFVLLSGHHDTWHYGVMDNGGANATMIEVARILAEHRRVWRRGLRICFWSGHSHGRYSGSAWYADEYWDELERRCVAHVNVDSTGGESATVLTNSGVVDELKGLAAEAVCAVSGQVHAGRRQGRVADQSFWGIGIPSMFGSISHQPPGPVKMPSALGWWWHTPHDLIEHIDPANLVRDTRVVLRVLWRLLTDPVLPLDYCAYAQALLAELNRLLPALDERLDIGPLIALAAELGTKAEAVKHHAEALERRAIINAALMRASRALVAINYTRGDRFQHDPALPQSAWAALEGLRELVRQDEASPDLPFYVVHARRTRNRITHALREAIAALDAVLQIAAASDARPATRPGHASLRGI
jgi:hypothetical protein